MERSYDVAVVGGGAAGLSAALVLGRARRSVVVVDAGSPRNASATHLHGYLSRDGADPAEVLERGRVEVQTYGVELRSASVADVAPEGDGFAVGLDDGAAFRARRVVLATGIVDDLPDVPGLAEGWGSDVLHCPYCHGHEIADGRLVVLASHPGSAHQAKLMRQWSDHVVLATNEIAEVDGDQRTELKRRGIEVRDGKVVAVERTDDRLRAVLLDSGERIEADAVFTVPRMSPPSTLVERLDLVTEETPMGPAVRAGENGRTSCPGVWAAGNITDPSAQVVTAASAGALAGMDINADLVEADARNL
jgi:thioredoxin reductase